MISVIAITRPRNEVAAFAPDPSNATAWYENSAQPRRVCRVHEGAGTGDGMGHGNANHNDLEALKRVLEGD